MNKEDVSRIMESSLVEVVAGRGEEKVGGVTHREIISLCELATDTLDMRVRRKLKAKFTLLFNEEGMRVEIEDKGSGSVFFTASFDEKQACQILSRLSRVETTGVVHRLDVVGKKYECRSFEVELPGGIGCGENYKERAVKLGMEQCPEGWELNPHLDSQNSFFTSGDKTYARFSIRRWNRVEEGKEVVEDE